MLGLRSLTWTAALHAAAGAQALLPGFANAPEFAEQLRWSRLDGGVRVFVAAPARLAAERRLLVIYATPNGNTIEQTLGCAKAAGRDWRCDIQHVAAQVRRWREVDTRRDVVLAVVQAETLSWPAFRAGNPGAGKVIVGLVEALARDTGAARVVLSCHSGGGSFVWGYLNQHEAIPPLVERIALLDANYSYSDADRHGDKLLAWLAGDAARRLVVLAYDDREIVLDGKKVIGPDGGTFRASRRMLERFAREVELHEDKLGPFVCTRSADGRIDVRVHENSDNKILHTALVGEMNGLLHALALGTEHEGTWGRLGGPRAYGAWVQREPWTEPGGPASRPASRAASATASGPAALLALPPRAADAPGGAALRDRLAALPPAEREAAVVRELVLGNVPESLRRLVPIGLACTGRSGARHGGTCWVTHDCVALGRDGDSFRYPLTPRAALAVADAAGCTLPTARLCDLVHAAAGAKLEPRPLTKDREALATFYQHHELVEQQLGDGTRAALVAGAKKDLVWTARLAEKPHKVAIYGWHHPDGRPIQPLYAGHSDRYVDYSHGVRLVAAKMVVDGKPTTVAAVLRDPELCALLSGEGPLDVDALRQAVQWER